MKKITPLLTAILFSFLAIIKTSAKNFVAPQSNDTIVIGRVYNGNASFTADTNAIRKNLQAFVNSSLQL